MTLRFSKGSSEKKDSPQIVDDNVLFKKLIENSYSGIALLDENLKIIYRSPSAERISGWNTESRMELGISDLTHPSDVERVNAVLQEVLTAPGVPKTCSFRSRHINGHYVWLQFTFTNMLNEADVKAIVCNFIDITNQKQSEEKLQQTVNELSAYKYALDEAAIVAITDQKGVIKHVNDNFCRISKYTKDELIGHDHRIINSSYHSKAFIAELWETITSGKIWRGELKNKAKDESNYWVDTTIVPFLDDKGKPYQYVAIRSDITRRKEEEQRSKLLESVITNTTDAVLITDAEPMDEFGPRIIYVNEAFTKMTGYTAEEIIGKTPDVLHGPKSDQDELKRLRDAIRNFKPYEVTIINYKKNGEEFWVNSSVSPVADDNGKNTHLIAIERDVTQHKAEEIQRNLLAEAVTNAYNERNTILESIADAFFAVDRDWVVTYWNKTASKVLGKSKEEILGYNLWDVFSDAIGSASYQQYHQAIKTNVAVHFEDYYPPLDKWYEISAYPSGNGLSVYFKDITDRKLYEIRLTELNQSLQKQTRELAISNAELEQFAYVASHDLQEPLRMVTSFLTQIEKKYAAIIDDKGKQYIHFAVDGAKRMRQIILDLLEYSRVGRAEESVESIDLNIVVNDIIALYKKRIEDKKAVIICEKLPVIRASVVPIRQVFQNLISNALKYHKAGNAPLINISFMDDGKYWHFAVKDNGIGIDPEYFDKIFIIFQRLHNKDEYSGTGMGLAVTKKIIDNLGGKIWVESEEGKGSTFYFTILKN